MRRIDIPDGWSLLPLSSLAKVQTGIAKGNRVNGATVSRPYLRVANVQDGFLDLSVMKEIGVHASKIDRYTLRNGDVLFTEGGDFDKLGRGTVWREEISGCLHQNHVFAVRVDADELLPEFLAYQAASGFGRRYFVSSSKQSTNLASINSTQLKQYPVLHPPLAEQRRIAEILSAWDEAIDKTEQLIKAKERRLYALTNLFVFGKIRAPSFSGKGLIEEQRWFSHPPDWKIVSIGEIACELSERNEAENGRTVLSCSKYDGFVESLRYFKKQIFSKDTSNYKVIRRGEFGYPSNHIEEGSIGLQNIVDEGIVSPIYTVFAINKDIADNGFLYKIFKTTTYRHIFKVSTSSSVDRRGSLRWSEFSKIKIPLPSMAEQQSIDAILNEASLEIALLKKKQSQLQRQKRGLMQKLLTGEWRVSTEDVDG